VLDGHLGGEDLLIAPGRLEVAVAQVSLQEIPVARVLRGLEHMLNGAVLFGDLQIQHLSLLLS
jgi:hypothetical protein